jgi:hypothetical protein
MTEPPDPDPSGNHSAPVLSNTQRLRSHLARDSLAAALLTAWETGNPAQAQSRMLAALQAFHGPKQANDAQTAA